MGNEQDWETSEAGELSLDSPLSFLSEKKPYRNAEDKRGHDLFLGARFPKSFARWVTKILEAPGSPYEIRADAVRDAVYLGLIVISLRQKLSSEWQIIEKVEQVRARISERAEIFRNMERLVADLETLCSNGDKETAREELQSFASLLDNLSYDRKTSFNSALKEKLKGRRLLELLQEV